MKAFINIHKIALFNKLAPLFCFFAVSMTCLGIGTILESTQTMQTMDTLQGGDRGPRQYKNQKNRPSGNRQTINDLNTSIKSYYQEMVKQLNEGKLPDKQQVQTGLAALRVPQSAVAKMPGDLQSKYFMLSAWTNYFNDNIKKAQQAAMRALKYYPQNKDAHITQTAISMLCNTKPSKPPKPRNPKTSQRPAAPVLDLNIDEIKADIIGLSVTDMNLKCINSTSFEYKTTLDNLCVILWKLSDKEIGSIGLSEPNDVTQTRKTTQRPADNFNRFEGFENFDMQQMGYYTNISKKKTSLGASMAAFKKIFTDTFGQEQLKFLAVNKDISAAKSAVMKKLLNNSWPWAHVMEHDPQSGAVQFKGIQVEHDKPVLLLISKEGTVTYAGPAGGFLAPMMVSKMAGIKHGNFMPTEAIPGDSSALNIFKNMMGKTINKQPAVKATTANPVTPTVNSQPEHPRPVEMSLADEVQAQRLLENCKTFIKLGRKALSYKKGIEYCREAMKKYPDTKYAEQARELLRQVPPRYHKRYGITNEELGL